MHLLKQTVTMQTEERVYYLNCHLHVPSSHVLANSRHTCTYDVTVWLSRTTDNSNIFIRSREVRDNESRLYSQIKIKISLSIPQHQQLPSGTYGCSYHYLFRFMNECSHLLFTSSVFCLYIFQTRFLIQLSYFVWNTAVPHPSKVLK